MRKVAAGLPAERLMPTWMDWLALMVFFMDISGNPLESEESGPSWRQNTRSNSWRMSVYDRSGAQEVLGGDLRNTFQADLWVVDLWFLTSRNLDVDGEHHWEPWFSICTDLCLFCIF